MATWIIITTILCYLGILFWVAYLSGRKASNTGFFIGNRQSNWVLVTIAMVGAAMSGVTFVSVPGMVNGQSFSYFQMALGFLVGQFIVAFVLIPLFYRMKLVSIYEYLEHRLGMSAYKTGAWFFFISKLLGASVRIFLVCLVLQFLVFDVYNIPFILNCTLVIALVFLYTFSGGVKSLIWTDSLKTLCLIASIVLCLVYVANGIGQSFKETLSEIWNSESSQIFFFEDGRDTRYFFKQFIAGIFTLIAMTGLDQDLMQRNMSCKNSSDAKKNIIISSIIQTGIIFLFLVLGAVLYMYAAKTGFELPQGGDKMFPAIATSSSMPVIVGIFFVLGLISSTFSAAGSAMTALTTSFTIDILGAKAENTEQLTQKRKRVHLFMAFAMIITIYALYKFNNTSIINAVYTLASYTYGPILGMFAFGILTKFQVRGKWIGCVAILSPILCFVLQQNSEKWMGGYKFSYELLIVNALITFLGMCLMIKKSKKEKI
ncbi:MAG: sodium:solute symporter [Alistipes sp.]|nr:sodium:solute symporter [Candidatus Alistipes equi]